MSVQKWEYCFLQDTFFAFATAGGPKTVSIPPPYWEGMVKTLYTLGTEGWELAGVWGAETRVMVLKRPKL